MLRIGPTATMHSTYLQGSFSVVVATDLTADWVELRASLVGDQDLTKEMLYHSAGGALYARGVVLHQIVVLSAAMVGDAAFSRQLRRKLPA